MNSMYSDNPITLYMSYRKAVMAGTGRGLRLFSMGKLEVVSSY